MTKKRNLFKKSRWLLLLLPLSYLHWYPRDFVDSLIFDLTYENPYVATKDQLESLLDTWPSIKGNRLPKSYQTETGLDLPGFKGIRNGTSHYLLSKKDVYRKVVGHVRIRDLIARDHHYKNAWLLSSDTLYWGIDSRILFRLIDLQDLLTEKGYDRDAFWVRHGHRHPKYNEAVGGAGKSRHLYGDAVDLVIKDIDQNGRYTTADKDIVLDLCEKYIIKSQGGIGRYPWSRTVHIDLRGRRARWDSY